MSVFCMCCCFLVPCWALMYILVLQKRPYWNHSLTRLMDYVHGFNWYCVQLWQRYITTTVHIFWGGEKCFLPDITTCYHCYRNSGFYRVIHGRPDMARLSLGLWNKRNQSWYSFRHWLTHSSILLWYDFLVATFLVTDSNRLLTQSLFFFISQTSL